ncbi:MAG: hypothetical protein KJI71_04015 [Patescibacteria group bacterium]|nr:hypothetical protein [Patescibacteria group bacterium]
MFNKILITFILVLFSIFIIFSEVGATTSTQETSTIVNPDYLELLNLFQNEKNELARSNRDYLAITLSAIFAFLALGGFFSYFTNFLPFRKRMKKYEELRKKDREIIQTTKDSIRKEFNVELEKTEEKLNIFFQEKIEENKKIMEDRQKEILSDFEEQKVKQLAGIARSQANYCSNSNLHDLSFTWALEAAYYFEKGEASDLSSAWLRKAEEEIIASDTIHFDIEFFEKNLEIIKEHINYLEGKYEVRIARIKELLKSKLDKSKQPT